MTKIVQLVNSCRECPNRHYYSGGTYECEKVQPSRLNADMSIPDWCPLADYRPWPVPAFAGAAAAPIAFNAATTWRTGPSGWLVRVCEASDAECSRGCNVGPCLNRTLGVTVRPGSQICAGAIQDTAAASGAQVPDAEGKTSTDSRCSDSEFTETAAAVSREKGVR